MSAGFRAFMEKLMDYAGLFPPASLPMETAIRNYIDYTVMPEKWLLGRFVCPAMRLEELPPFLEDPSLGRVLPLSLAVLSRPEVEKDRFLEQFRKDASAVCAFAKRLGEGARIECYEARLPAEIAGTQRPAEAEALLEDMVHLLEAEGAPVRPIFLELGFTEDYHVPVKTLVRALAGFNRVAGPDGSVAAGFKIRCGGSDPSDFPDPDQVSYALALLAGSRVPFKATGGIQHAVRRYNPRMRTRVFGFFNLFGAGILAGALGLDQLKLRKVLVDESAASFSFTDKGFSWREHTVGVEEIARQRAAFATTLTTSTYVDPRHELEQLHLLG